VSSLVERILVQPGKHLFMTHQKSPRVRRKSAADPRQLEIAGLLDRLQLVDVPAAPSRAEASHDLSRKIRLWANEAIRLSPLSREQIADSMSALTGQTVTKTMLDCWTGASRANRFPAEFLPAFCIAAGNNHIMDQLAADMGARLIDTGEAVKARMAQWAVVIAHGLEDMRSLAQSLPLRAAA